MQTHFSYTCLVDHINEMAGSYLECGCGFLLPHRTALFNVLRVHWIPHCRLTICSHCGVEWDAFLMPFWCRRVMASVSVFSISSCEGVRSQFPVRQAEQIKFVKLWLLRGLQFAPMCVSIVRCCWLLTMLLEGQTGLYYLYVQITMASFSLVLFHCDFAVTCACLGCECKAFLIEHGHGIPVSVFNFFRVWSRSRGCLEWLVFNNKNALQQTALWTCSWRYGHVCIFCCY